jgi:hypothetical protein
MNIKNFLAQARSNVKFVNLRGAAGSRLTLANLKSQVFSLKCTFLRERRLLPKKDFLISDVHWLIRTSPLSLTIRLSKLHNGF